MSLTDFLKATGNSFAVVADDGISAGDVASYIDTGSYALNAVVSGSLYGGVPSNRVTAFASETGVGKTYLALAAAKNFLKSNPEGMVICFESESAISKQMLLSRGIDTKRFGVVSVTTIQEFKTQILKVIDRYSKSEEKTPMLFILDSLGMLSTTKEMEDSLVGKETKDMTRASMIKSAFRTITLSLGRIGVPLLVTNHVYADLAGGLYAGQVMGGGQGIAYSSSTILTLTKAKPNSPTLNKLDKPIDSDFALTIEPPNLCVSLFTSQLSLLKSILAHLSNALR